MLYNPRMGWTGLRTCEAHNHGLVLPSVREAGGSSTPARARAVSRLCLPGWPLLALQVMEVVRVTLMGATRARDSALTRVRVYECSSCI